MIVVIQCAGSKAANAGCMRTRDGRSVIFVAQPEQAPVDGVVHARPDDPSEEGCSWRELVQRYNTPGGANPLGLLPAQALYSPPAYRHLSDWLGAGKIFILSAGWGLIPGDFLTPNYDITFSAAARGKDAYKRRSKSDRYDDFCMLPADTSDPVLFLGGSDYLPLFLALTERVSAPRIVMHASAAEPLIPGCIPARFVTTRRTNWHYSCAEALLAGTLRLPVEG